MIEHLHSNPDKHFYINNQNDAEAKLLLGELGMLGDFEEKSPDRPSPDQVAIGECLSHFIVAILFTDDPDQGKNGFLVFAVPKRQTPPRQMRALLRGIIEDFKISNFEVTDAMFSEADGGGGSQSGRPLRHADGWKSQR
jgi:hypothetical protein